MVVRRSHQVNDRGGATGNVGHLFVSVVLSHLDVAPLLIIAWEVGVVIVRSGSEQLSRPPSGLRSTNRVGLVSESPGLEVGRLLSENLKMSAGSVPQVLLLCYLALELDRLRSVARHPLVLSFEILLGGDGIGDLVVLIKRERLCTSEVQKFPIKYHSTLKKGY
jgi:hypothetical protein